MTTTGVRPAEVQAPTPRRPARTDRGATRRTLMALLACALGAMPLKALFSDTAWLLDVWVSMAIVIAPAALIRMRRPAGALDVWPGIVLLVPWLTARFVGEHAYLGIVPSGGTWHDVSALMTDLHQTSTHEVAPIHTTVAVRLVVCALLGLLAALVDLIAVVGRRGALAGVPLLVVYTVAGAVPRAPVSWPWFALAAAGFLVLLALDAGDDLDGWGRRVRSPDAARGRGVLAVSTQRIAAVAIAVAVVVPFVVPNQSRNLIADAFHGGGGNGVGGFGDNGTSSGISPFAALKGQLVRPNPIVLGKVHLLGDSAKQHPYNLRLNVLSHYSDEGWSVEGHGSGEPLDLTDYGTEPETLSPALNMDAEITIAGLTGNAPVFTVPNNIGGLSSATTWSAQDQILLGAKINRGTKYTVEFNESRPSLDDLNNATDVTGLTRYLQGGDSVPTFVKDLVAGLTANKTTAYAKTRAISDYFADTKNGFIYSLQVPPGDSGSALVDFLKSKQGFCQQYAAAMAVMLRVAGVPSRVVLGYEHEDADAQGNFTFTTNDAHAWVEAYFGGVGWIPFDPTPIGGLSGTAESDLRWAPHAYPSNAPSSSATSKSTGPVVNKPRDSDTAAAPAASDNGGSAFGFGVPLAIVVGLLIVGAVVLTPAFVRWRRRRRRYAAVRASADAEALWSELSDTAVDLGYVWSAARSPRQVVAWLGRDAAESASALREIAAAVERRRYSGAAGGSASGGSASGGSAGASVVDGNTLAGDLRSVSDALREHHRGRIRLRALLWPASLGWGRRSGRRQR